MSWTALIYAIDMDFLQSGSDYGPYLANEASPLHTTTIVERCTEKLVDDWNRMRANVSHCQWSSSLAAHHTMFMYGTDVSNFKHFCKSSGKLTVLQFFF